MVNGYPFRGRIAKYGGTYLLGFKRELREAADIEEGDVLDLDLELDTEPREVDVPSDLEAALDGQSKAAFDRVLHAPQGVRRLDRGGQAAGDARAPSRKAVEMIREGKLQR